MVILTLLGSLKIKGEFANLIAETTFIVQREKSWAYSSLQSQGVNQFE